MPEKPVTAFLSALFLYGRAARAVVKRGERLLSGDAVLGLDSPHRVGDGERDAGEMNAGKRVELALRFGAVVDDIPHAAAAKRRWDRFSTGDIMTAPLRTMPTSPHILPARPDPPGQRFSRLVEAAAHASSRRPPALCWQR